MSEIETVIRGTCVTVYGDNYTEDPSVGLGFGPEEVWAELPDGSQFELTDDEENDFSQKLADIKRDDYDQYDQGNDQ